MENKRPSSRVRLQEAAKDLFAERGYEGTTVAAIVQRAKTSYSQFIAHFADKAGFRTEILQEGWGHINSAIRLATAKSSAPRDKLKLTIDVLISYLERDPAFRTLFLLEKAATRDQGTLVRDAGISDFIEILDSIFQELANAGGLSPNVDPHVLRSALVGALEGMLRDQLISEHSQAGASYTESAMHLVFSNFLSSVLQTASEMPAPPRRVPAKVLEQAAEGVLEFEGDQLWIHHYLNLAAIALGPPGNA